jgi:hypothetical protein
MISLPPVARRTKKRIGFHKIFSRPSNTIVVPIKPATRTERKSTTCESEV